MGETTRADFEYLCQQIIGPGKAVHSLKEKPWCDAPILIFYNQTELLSVFLPLAPNMSVLLTDNIACTLELSNNTIFPTNTIYIRKSLYALVEISSSEIEINSYLISQKRIYCFY